jgi:beta-galactosidase
MQRREFLKVTTSAITGSTYLPRTTAGESRLGEHPPSTGRMVLSLNRNWRYSKFPVKGGHDREFDDSAFEQVVIPHTNIRLPWHGFDDRSYEFVSLYRRHIRLPPEARGKYVFVDFEGVMTAATIWINGMRLGEYKGGYTPFSFDLTPHVDWDADNLLAVDVDSTERSDIPPFGHQIDYLTFGGIYREVSLRIVPGVFIENMFVQPQEVLSSRPSLDIDCFLMHLDAWQEPQKLEVDLRDGDQVIATGSLPITPGGIASKPAPHRVRLENLGPVRLWELSNPKLYSVQVRLLRGNELMDSDQRSFGFREAQFTDHGFELNGKVVKLRGLDRHQTFPYVGQAMPARVQREDAKILRRDLKCNIVRTSHYPQSRHFLDACDEFGLLVLEEIPGWQHIGDEAWKLISIDNVSRMIRRDWNHPSIVLWSVRINESEDDHSFYTRTNAVAHRLDPTRQTGGVRDFQSSEFLEEVFTVNDFGFPLKPPNHPRYLNTEFVGHTYPTKTIDQVERLREHVLRHARIHDQLASDPQYAGGIGWCAFDYNTHADFGAGDRICYHGIADIFREPKPAAGFYKSQCDPAEEVVLEPAFHWARGDESVGFTKALVCSNCDHLKFYIAGELVAEAGPDRRTFPHLPHVPFVADLSRAAENWGDLRIDGFIQGKQVISKTMSGRGIDQKFVLLLDDTKLNADGADTTRVVIRVTDEYGAIRPFADAAIKLDLDGPADLIGDNPFALVGGTGAVWIRAREEAGTLTLTATHPVLGRQYLRLELMAVPPEVT